MDIYIHQDKFHQIVLKKYYISKIKKEEMTIRRLLCYYQELACKSYPTEAKMSLILGELYDAKFHVSLTFFASYSLFTYTLTAVDPTFLEDKEYTLKRIEEIFLLLIEAKMNSASADKVLFNRACEIYESNLLSLKENLQTISIDRALMHYFKGTTRDFSNYGNLEELSKITPKMLFSYYERLKEEETISIGTGRMPASKLEKNITLTPKRNYHFKDRKNPCKQIIEKAKSQQCYLNIIYETHLFLDDPLSTACSFLNYILGGSSSSYLFQKVREEQGLCYYISSSYLGASGIILISCILDPKNIDKALKAIDEALEEIKNFNFDLDEIKNIFISNHRFLEDDLDTVIQNYLSDTYFLDTPKSLKEISLYRKVTQEDIGKVYQGLKKSFVYILGGNVDAE
ncbi:MAG: insulinase family protein [Roseburia sp.]|nr:insulinase family protein [Anaeroplasma bactoclasticum]MCM1196116.1 insulinase family protein [Roseburia sp.]MCM1556002.1 insulinase family protein [Anaeroplasma bactoclasticum]